MYHLGALPFMTIENYWSTRLTEGNVNAYRRVSRTHQLVRLSVWKTPSIVFLGVQQAKQHSMLPYIFYPYIKNPLQGKWSYMVPFTVPMFPGLSDHWPIRRCNNWLVDRQTNQIPCFIWYKNSKILKNERL